MKEEPWKVGEIAELTNLTLRPEYNNQKCIIIAGLQERTVIDIEAMVTLGQQMTYRVRVLHDNMAIGPRPDQLKPRVRPPVEDVPTSVTIEDWSDPNNVKEVSRHELKER
jgi:hypothetical protein